MKKEILNYVKSLVCQMNVVTTTHHHAGDGIVAIRASYDGSNEFVDVVTYLTQVSRSEFYIQNPTIDGIIKFEIDGVKYKKLGDKFCLACMN